MTFECCCSGTDSNRADFDFDFVQIGDTKLLVRPFCSLLLIKDAGVSLGVPIVLFDLSLQINDSSNTLVR